jgi:hypothetical protein
MDEIIDRAMARHMRGCLDRLSATCWPTSRSTAHPGEPTHCSPTYLPGTLMQQAVRPLPFSELMTEISSTCRLDAALSE